MMLPCKISACQIVKQAVLAMTLLLAHTHQKNEMYLLSPFATKIMKNCGDTCLDSNIVFVVMKYDKYINHE
jgi:hypothetical protein